MLAIATPSRRFTNADMDDAPESFRLDPRRVAGLDLAAAPGRRRRLMLRTMLWLSCGAVRVEGRERIERAAGGSIFALSHHGSWEALLAPATLVALRGGRPIRFLVDWMFAELPWSAWLVREIDPIPVYRKRARFGFGERRRRARLDFDPIAEAAATIERGGDVGLYPEGTRRGAIDRLSRLRGGLARLASATGAAIVPVGVDLPARERLGRSPKVGRIVLRAGESIRCDGWDEGWTAAQRRTAERALLERVAGELARLSRKRTADEPARERRVA